MFLTSRSLLPRLGNSPVSMSRGKEFGHDVDIIFTTLELGKEENLLLDVIKSLEKQVCLKNPLFLLHVDGKSATIGNSTSKRSFFCAVHHVDKVRRRSAVNSESASSRGRPRAHLHTLTFYLFDRFFFLLCILSSFKCDGVNDG